VRFSQRYGYSPIKNVVQSESIDQDLRNSLWSVATLHYWSSVKSDADMIHPQVRLSAHGNEDLQLLCRRLWLNFFREPLDTLADSWTDVRNYLRGLFFSCAWHEVYDLLEFLAQNHPDEAQNASFMHAANVFMERELSAYRFVERRIVRITAPEEIEAIEKAVAAEKSAVRDHLESAIRLLADRRAPDHRNSIKESISAVEALVRSVSGSEKGTLGDLLKQLSRRHPIHPALEAAFIKLYGYTSDASGIRHALIEGESAAFEEAKFMLVACSAFVNYVHGALKS
jgi:hypothetical protein